MFWIAIEWIKLNKEHHARPKNDDLGICIHTKEVSFNPPKLSALILVLPVVFHPIKTWQVLCQEPDIFVYIWKLITWPKSSKGKAKPIGKFSGHGPSALEGRGSCGWRLPWLPKIYTYLWDLTVPLKTYVKDWRCCTE